jgi:uncharacterized repeat protein (TIGR03833 family)
MISINAIFENPTVESQFRKNIKIGDRVEIIQKKDQHSGKVTVGTVQAILTKKPKHTRGIKVLLSSGEVGRVQKILD